MSKLLSNTMVLLSRSYVSPQNLQSRSLTKISRISKLEERRLCRSHVLSHLSIRGGCQETLVSGQIN